MSTFSYLWVMFGLKENNGKNKKNKKEKKAFIVRFRRKFRGKKNRKKISYKIFSS